MRSRRVKAELVGFITKGTTPHLKATNWNGSWYCKVMVESKNTKFYQVSELYSMMEAVELQPFVEDDEDNDEDEDDFSYTQKDIDK
jgi:hypothetical protein